MLLFNIPSTQDIKFVIREGSLGETSGDYLDVWALYLNGPEIEEYKLSEYNYRKIFEPKKFVKKQNEELHLTDGFMSADPFVLAFGTNVINKLLEEPANYDENNVTHHKSKVETVLSYLANDSSS